MFILQITFLLSGFTVWTQTPSETGFGTADLWARAVNLHPQGCPCCPAPQPWAHLPVPQPGQTSRHYGCTHSRKKKKTRRRPVEPVALRSSHRQQGPVAWLHAHLRNNWEPKVFKPLASPILLKQMQQIQVLKLYSKYCCILSVS